MELVHDQTPLSMISVCTAGGSLPLVSINCIILYPLNQPHSSQTRIVDYVFNVGSPMTMEIAWRNLFGVLFCCTLVRSNVCNSYNILPPETAVKTEGFSMCGQKLMFFSLQICEGELLTDLLGKKTEYL